MAVAELRKLTLEELTIGMQVTAEQLSDIYDTYMIIQYDNNTDIVGKLVYIGKTQTDEYGKWFMQSKPITPIYNDKEELEDMAVYDE